MSYGYSINFKIYFSKSHLNLEDKCQSSEIRFQESEYICILIWCSLLASLSTKIQIWVLSFQADLSLAC